MSLQATVLFAQPAQAVVSLLKESYRNCRAAWIVSGFATVEGVEALRGEIRAAPDRLQAFIVGSSTYKGFEAIDRLLVDGVAHDRVWVHLGYSRATKKGATHPFYRYHPMLHSKICLFEMQDGTWTAYVGSHNVTGFALLGLNGEAGIKLEAPSGNVEIAKIQKHIQEAIAQAAAYAPTMKEDLTWWTTMFVDGLRAKVNDKDRDDEGKRTIVVIGAATSRSVPQKEECVYFEIPRGLGQLKNLGDEVHIYLFDNIPRSPAHALLSLQRAKAALFCKTVGLDLTQGGVEVEADWHIQDRRTPLLLSAPKPFRPTTPPDMQQVRVKVLGKLFPHYEYLFQADRVSRIPVLDGQRTVCVQAEYTRFLSDLKLVPPEDKEWQLVRGIQRSEPSMSGDYLAALNASNPESGNFVLFSLRRRRLDDNK